MPQKIDRKAKYKKGDKVHLDEVMDILGLIPHEYYKQDDPADWEIGNDNTSGEIVEFLADFELKATIFLDDLTE